MTGLGLEQVAALTRERFAWQDDNGAAITADVVEQVQRCSDRWGLVLEGAFAEGVGPPVLWGSADGRPAVLKIGWEPAFRQQCRTLVTAAGRGYVAVLAHHDDAGDRLRGALLLERLGPSLGEQPWSPERQLSVLGALLPSAWDAVADLDVTALDVAATPAKVAKGEYLRQILADHAALVPGQGGLLAAADECAASLDARGHHPVVVHGDPHPANVLQRPDGTWAFVDPDGFRCDAAYDMGVTVRGWNAELQAVADTDGAAAARSRLDEWCVLVTAGTGVDPELVRDWAFVERVTTGLWLIKFGYGEEGRGYLAIAELLR